MGNEGQVDLYGDEGKVLIDDEGRVDVRGDCCGCSLLLYIDDRPVGPLNSWTPGLLVGLEGALKVHAKPGWVAGSEYQLHRVFNLWAAAAGVVNVAYWDDANYCHHRLGLRVNGQARNWDSGPGELIDTREAPAGPRYDSVTLQEGDRLQLYIRNVDPVNPEAPCIPYLLPWRSVTHDDLSWRTVGAGIGGCTAEQRFYKLTSCDGRGTYYTDEPLLSSVGKIIKDVGVPLPLGAGYCWQVEAHTQVSNPVDSYAWKQYDECGQCLDDCDFRLVDCDDPQHVIYTYNCGLLGWEWKVARLSDGKCYIIYPTVFEGSYTKTRIRATFATCGACQGAYPPFQCSECGTTQPDAAWHWETPYGETSGTYPFKDWEQNPGSSVHRWGPYGDLVVVCENGAVVSVTGSGQEAAEHDVSCSDGEIEGLAVWRSETEEGEWVLTVTFG